MIAARRWASAWALCAVLGLTGCASLRFPAAVPTGASWSGRLALQVRDDAAQSFSAAFELRGAPESGELTLFTPLGGTAALLRWTPGAAVLVSNGQTRQFESLDALVLQATGAALPVTALFDWLAGTPTPVAGWRPDVSGLPQGRLLAHRMAPPPVADLRVVLDR